MLLISGILSSLAELREALHLAIPEGIWVDRSSHSRLRRPYKGLPRRSAKTRHEASPLRASPKASSGFPREREVVVERHPELRRMRNSPRCVIPRSWNLSWCPKKRAKTQASECPELLKVFFAANCTGSLLCIAST